MPRVVAILQARMSSTRLPGKVLREVAGEPLLGYQLSRVGLIPNVHEVVVATSTEPSDDAIQKFCESRGRPCFRGSLKDVLGRYARCAEQFRADTIMRLTADCPLIDPEVSALVLKRFLDAVPAVDYASNALNRSYPRGLDTEVFSLGALLAADRQATDPAEREHVTMHFYRNTERYKTLSIANQEDLSGHRWTVDTEEDFDLIARLIGALRSRWPHFGVADILAVLKAHPQWQEINAHVEQKKT